MTKSELKVKINQAIEEIPEYVLEEILDYINKVKEISQRPNTHWNILYRLYLELNLNSFLIKNNGFHNKTGIFEISLKKTVKNSGKKNLLGYFNGM